MTDHRKAVLDFVRHERDWIGIHFACLELVQLSKFSEEWPKLSLELWRVEIDAAVKSGELITDGQRVKAATEKKAIKPTQGELF